MKTTSAIYDPHSGSEMMTAEQSADYLGYHYASIRRLVREKALKPYTSIGKAFLFLKADIVRFQGNHPWAAGKAGREKQTNPSPEPPRKLEASVVVSRRDKIFDGVWKTDPDFTWDKLPLIKADVNSAFGDQDFTVKVTSPDGGNWAIRYFPVSPLDTAIKKVTNKFKGK